MGAQWFGTAWTVYGGAVLYGRVIPRVTDSDFSLGHRVLITPVVGGTNGIKLILLSSVLGKSTNQPSCDKAILIAPILSRAQTLSECAYPACTMAFIHAVRSPYFLPFPRRYFHLRVVLVAVDNE